MVGAASALSIAAASCALALAVAPSFAQTYIVTGHCRAGAPSGAYELRMGDGRLRVAGAFSEGRLTGTFIFWTTGGARLAVLPFDNDAKSGTVALWYAARGAAVEAGRKLEAPYVGDRLHGSKRSWHANGMPRAEYRYRQGVLTAARGWTEQGVPLSAAAAREQAERDAGADDRFYATLLAMVRDHLPPCGQGSPPGRS